MFVAQGHMVQLEALWKAEQAFWRFLGIIALVCAGLAVMTLLAGCHRHHGLHLAEVSRPVPTDYVRVPLNRSQGRSLVQSSRGLVASEHPLASQAGAMVLAGAATP